MFKNEYKLSVDVKKSMSNTLPVFVQYDSATLVFRILDGGKPFDLDGFTKAEISHRRPDGITIVGQGTLETTPSGENLIRYTYLGNEMNQLGFVETSLSVFSDNKKVTTFPFNVKIVKDLREGLVNNSKEELGILQELIAEVSQVVKQATEQIDRAENALVEIDSAIQITQEALENIQTLVDSTQQAADDAITATSDLNLALANFTHRDEYSDTTNYVKNNIVSYLGSSYMCVAASQGILPTTETHWKLIAEKGKTGATGKEGIQGLQGIQGETGKAFTISKTYSSIAQMNADYSNAAVAVGDFVLINTNDVQNEDNAKLYVKTETAYSYLVDLSGAKGTDGISFVWKKEYNPATTYQKDDVVFYDGSSFIALKTLTNILPVNDNVNWSIMTQRGIDGTGSVVTVNNISPDLNGNVVLPLHEHTNKQVLDGLAEVDGKLKFKGREVGSVTSVNGETGDVIVQGFSGKYTDLTEVPATFFPSPHEHALTEITGLQTELNKKETIENVNKKLAQTLADAKSYTDLNASEVGHFEYSVPATTDGQTVFEIPLDTFDFNKDKISLFINRSPLAFDDFTVNGKTITLLNDSVDSSLGESLYIEIIKNIQNIPQDTLSGAFIENGTVTQDKLAFSIPTLDSNGNILDGNGNPVEGKVLSVNGMTGDVFGLEMTRDSDIKLATKVDKVEGKQLSTEDFTSIEKSKLENIAENANNYQHPDTAGNKHIPSGGASGNYLKYSSNGVATWYTPTTADIVELSSRKFVSELKINEWNAKPTTDYVDGKTGVLNDLSTTAKTNLVAAINEVNAKQPVKHTHTTSEIEDLDFTIENLQLDIDSQAAILGDTRTLTTTSKNDIVSAINEVNAKPSGGGNEELISTVNLIHNPTAMISFAPEGWTKLRIELAGVGFQEAVGKTLIMYINGVTDTSAYMGFKQIATGSVTQINSYALQTSSFTNTQNISGSIDIELMGGSESGFNIGVIEARGTTVINNNNVTAATVLDFHRGLLKQHRNIVSLMIGLQASGTFNRGLVRLWGVRKA